MPPEIITYHQHVDQERKGNTCWYSVHLNEDRETVIIDFVGGHTSSMHHMTKKDLIALKDQIIAVLLLMLPEEGPDA
jgi:N-methylhydantoinase B/oxoprolinase/acetone carboxylase alpha subunit